MKRFAMATLIPLAMLSSSLCRAHPTSRPANDIPSTAKTTAEITTSANQLKGFGDIQTVQFLRWGHQIFALWYCPFSGIGDCYVAAYYYDPQKQDWHRFINQYVKAGGDLSPEMPTGEEIIFRRDGGQIALKASVAGFPRTEPAPSVR
jgi:hypothetical protein